MPAAKGPVERRQLGEPASLGHLADGATGQQHLARPLPANLIANLPETRSPAASARCNAAAKTQLRALAQAIALPEAQLDQVAHAIEQAVLAEFAGLFFRVAGQHVMHVRIGVARRTPQQGGGKHQGIVRPREQRQPAEQPAVFAQPRRGSVAELDALGDELVVADQRQQLEEQQHQAFDLLAQRGIAQVVDVEDQPCRFPFDLEARGETAGENVLETHEAAPPPGRARTAAGSRPHRAGAASLPRPGAGRCRHRRSPPPARSRTTGRCHAPGGRPGSAAAAGYAGRRCGRRGWGRAEGVQGFIQQTPQRGGMGQAGGRRVVLHGGSSRLTKDFQGPSIRSMPRAGGIRRMLGTTTRRKDR